MTTQPEAILENNLIEQLIRLGYVSVKIHDGVVLVSNLRSAGICNPAV
jgi:type I restriction enzyme R subunit